MSVVLARTELRLGIGEVRFAGAETRLSTVLGSCVALTVWHPQRRIGGMCHFMLPTRPGEPQGELNGCYADEALALMLRMMRAARTAPQDYEAKLFGGGNMFPDLIKGPGVSAANAAAARDLVRAHGLRLAGSHLGGLGHRTVRFDIWSGEVWLRHCSAPRAAECREPWTAT